VPCALPALVWGGRFGGNTVYGPATAVTLDTEGGTVVTGHFNGMADFGDGTVQTTGTEDALVMAFDTAGHHRWFRHFGSPGNVTVGNRIALDGAGNVIVAGETARPVDFGGGPRCIMGVQHQVFVVKLDGQGQHLASVCFGSPAAQFESAPEMAVDGAGNILLAVRLTGSLDFGQGPVAGAASGSLAVVKLDPMGKLVWAHTFGAPGTTVGLGGIAAGQSGEVFVTGNVDGTIDFGGGPLANPNPGASNVFLARFDAGGAHVWSKLFTSEHEEGAAGLAGGPGGRLALTGTWVRTFDTDTIDLGTGPLSSPLFLATFDAAGAPLWSRSFGDLSGYHAATAVAWSDGGDIALLTASTEHIDFGCGDQFNDAAPSFMLARFDPAGHDLGNRYVPNAYGHGVAARGKRVAVAGEAPPLDPLYPVDLGGGPIPDNGTVLVGVFAP
jgi:hypothetical protein